MNCCAAKSITTTIRTLRRSTLVPCGSMLGDAHSEIAAGAPTYCAASVATASITSPRRSNPFPSGHSLVDTRSALAGRSPSPCGQASTDNHATCAAGHPFRTAMSLLTPNYMTPCANPARSTHE